MKIIILLLMLACALSDAKRSKRQFNNNQWYPPLDSSFGGDTPPQQQVLESPFNENVLNAPTNRFPMRLDDNPISLDMKNKYNGNLNDEKAMNKIEYLEMPPRSTEAPYLGRRNLSALLLHPGLSKLLSDRFEEAKTQNKNLSNMSLLDYVKVADAFKENKQNMEALGSPNLLSAEKMISPKCVKCPNIDADDCNDRFAECCECEASRRIQQSPMAGHNWWIYVAIVLVIVLALICCVVCCVIKRYMTIGKCLLRILCCCCGDRKKEKKKGESDERENDNNNNNSNNLMITDNRRTTDDDEKTSNDEDHDAIVNNLDDEEKIRNEFDLKEKLKEIESLLNKIVNDELKAIAFDISFSDKQKSAFVNEDEHRGDSSESVLNKVTTMSVDLEHVLKASKLLGNYLRENAQLTTNREIVNIKFKSDQQKEEEDEEDSRRRPPPVSKFQHYRADAKHDLLVRELIELQNEKMQKKADFVKIKKIYE